MKNAKIILTVGIPASGKGTWRTKFLAEHPNYVCVSRDDFRYMLRDSGWLDYKGENLVTDLVNNAIVTAVKNKFNVIVDQTNVNLKYLPDFVDWCRNYGDVEFQIFNITKEVAIERDANRERSVGKQVIEKMYKQYLELFDSNFDFSVRKKKVEIIKNITWNPDHELPNAVIYDIDGTVAHTQGKRGNFDWNKVYVDVVDEVLRENIRIHKEAGYKIIMVTGRDGSCADLTEEWLEVNGVPCDELYCRPAGNFEKDVAIKTKIYNEYIKGKYNVLGVYDDRSQVVVTWRGLGLKCFQVAEGNF
jgi:predicted kinase